MKHVLLLFSFFMVVGLTTANAQSCCKKGSKAATEGKACVGDKAKADMASAEVMEAAVKAASMDESVEKKVCETSGNVSFVRKSVCEKSGNVSFANVEFDAATAKFVNLAPADTDGKIAKSGKSCCAKGSKASEGCSSKTKAKASKKEKKALKAKI